MTMSSGRPPNPPRSGPPYSGNSLQGLPVGYLTKGYFDEKGNVLPAVIVDWAKAIALSLDSAKPELKMAQLRKFFGEARHIEGQLNAGKDFDALRGRILKLDVYAADSIQKSKAPLLFKQFVEANLKWAPKDKKSFIEGFIQHFESIVAYYPKRQ